MQYRLLSSFNKNTAGHPEKYFQERFTTLDFRGGLFIDPNSIWGFGNVTITQSHDIGDGEWHGAAIDRPVHVGPYAWVTSCCVLYNCNIGHHAVVSIGSVVANMTVEPYTMVAGNPARVVKRFNLETKTWEKA